MITAPTTEVIKLPIIPLAAKPNNENTHPPSNPPTIPNTKLIIKPNPPPRIILPAIKPANAPININHIKSISSLILVYNTTDDANIKFEN